MFFFIGGYFPFMDGAVGDDVSTAEEKKLPSSSVRVPVVSCLSSKDSETILKRQLNPSVAVAGIGVIPSSAVSFEKLSKRQLELVVSFFGPQCQSNVVVSEPSGSVVREEDLSEPSQGSAVGDE